ncbi:MAG: DUF2029 domain-containing protein [Calothrix sp. SM1_7_51]|nr:DUF2029 domain-containing protein [Calothrix sp. SM1_7_51]
MHSPLANLPYFPQKIIWFIFQWSALTASCFLVIKNYQNIFRTKITWIITLIFIFGNHFWRIHVSVGQIYVLYVFLLSLAYFVLQQNIKFKEIIAGLLIGITTSFRFPIIVMILPMILFRKFKLLGATLLSLFFSLLTGVIIAKPEAWFSYFSAMSTIGKFETTRIVKISNIDKIILPKIIEGDHNLGLPFIINSESSLQSLIRGLFNFQISGSILIVICCILFLAFIVAFNSTYKKEIKQNSDIQWDIFFICGSIIILIGDFFIPAPRYSYNDIQFLIPLLLILKNINLSNKTVIISVFLLMIGASFISGMFYWIPKAVVIGEYTILGAMISITLTLGALTKTPESSG